GPLEMRAVMGETRRFRSFAVRASNRKDRTRCPYRVACIVRFGASLAPTWGGVVVMPDPVAFARGLSAPQGASGEDDLDELASLKFEAWEPEELAPVLAVVNPTAWSEEGALLGVNLQLATVILGKSRGAMIEGYRERIAKDPAGSWEAIFGTI